MLEQLLRLVPGIRRIFVIVRGRPGVSGNSDEHLPYLLSLTELPQSLHIPDTSVRQVNTALELSTFAVQLPRSMTISDVLLLACTAEERMQKLYQRSMFHLLREDGQLAPALRAKVTVVEVIHHYLAFVCGSHIECSLPEKVGEHWRVLRGQSAEAEGILSKSHGDSAAVRALQ